MRLSVLLLAILALLLIMNVHNVYADDHDHDHDDEHDDDDDSVSERDIDVDQDSDRIRIEARSSVGEIEDEIDLEIETRDDEGLEIRFEYSSETDRSEAELEFRFRVYRIIEFRGSESYDETSEMVQEYVIGGNSAWDALDYQTVENVTTVMATTSDGVFSVYGYISTINDGMYDPNSFKFDVDIMNFPYSANDTRLALEMRVTRSYEFEAEEGVDSLSVMSSGLVSAVLSWVTTADANYTGFNTSQIIDIVNSEFEVVDSNDTDSRTDSEMEDEERIYFTFMSSGTMDELYWDPSVVVDYGSNLNSANAIKTVGSFVIAIATLLLMSL